MWEFFIKLAEAEQYKMLTVLAISLTLVAIAIVVGLIKLITLLAGRGVRVKHGNTEIGLGDPVDKLESNRQQIEEIAQEHSLHKFIHTVNEIVSASIDTGYSNCKKRQELFDTQMRATKDYLSLLQTNILEEYDTKLNGKQHDVAKVTLKYCIEKYILDNLREIFIEDRLAEISQDDLIEKHRPFIDRSYAEIKHDVIRTLNTPDEALLTALENQEAQFKRVIVDSLQVGQKEAKKCLTEVGQQNKRLNEKIDSAIQNYVGYSNTADLPETWLDPKLATPPADVVSGGN